MTTLQSAKKKPLAKGTAEHVFSVFNISTTVSALGEHRAGLPPPQNQKAEMPLPYRRKELP